MYTAHFEYTFSVFSLQALTSASFCVTVGQTVALVGPSGSGKSTIAKLIQRMYDPTSGKVSIWYIWKEFA